MPSLDDIKVDPYGDNIKKLRCATGGGYLTTEGNSKEIRPEVNSASRVGESEAARAEMTEKWALVSSK